MPFNYLDQNRIMFGGLWIAAVQICLLEISMINLFSLLDLDNLSRRSKIEMNPPVMHTIGSCYA